MDYPGALAYLSSLVDREKNERKKYKTSLVNFKEQLEKFSNPQKKLKGFLIGGTKGKGSTAYVVEAICRKAQFKTGLFTSPHLISYKERIKIDGEPIPKAKFASLIGERDSSSYRFLSPQGPVPCIRVWETCSYGHVSS
ncbi:MAG: hypothetical protein P8Z50_05700 [candidate division WOR-3 bacterium]